MNNRELKFRVYIPDRGKYSYFRLNEFDYSDRYLYQHQYPVQQYTGLKDSKGVEIYEGDLVCCSTEQYSITAPVVFSPFGYGFVLDSSGRHGIGDSKYGDYVPLLSPIVMEKKVTYEVVGNIFENKNNE